jgi:hypothetical protein
MQPEKVEARTVAADPSLENHADEYGLEIVSAGTVLDASKFQLERLTHDLAAIADWKDELQRKIRLAQLKFELVDCFAERDALVAEVEAFKEVCAHLCETMAIEENKSERKVA